MDIMEQILLGGLVVTMVVSLIVVVSKREASVRVRNVLLTAFLTFLGAIVMLELAARG